MYAAKTWVMCGHIDKCRGALPAHLVTVTMPHARLMVCLDALVDDIRMVEEMDLPTVCQTIHEAFQNNPLWEHPKKFNRNTIALAALQATLATADKGDSTVMADHMYATTCTLTKQLVWSRCTSLVCVAVFR
jgi:hypothetical protein